MIRSKKFRNLMIISLLFGVFYSYVGKEQLRDYNGDSSVIRDLRDFKMPTISETKAIYAENNTPISIPYLNIRFMDMITGSGIIMILLFFILKKLNV